ncbi:MAG: peptidase S41 [Cytophagaceae bacterium]|nr:peptidase S41 [Cytophagaceae bacterium]
MILKKWAALSLIALAVLGVSCKKLTEVNPAATENTSTTVNPNANANSWIYDEMKTYYLWESQMKTKATTDNKLDPMDYFESILVKPGELDRFSWIEEDVDALTASLQGVNKVLGIRYVPIFADKAESKVAFSVSYTLKGSPADKAGIKRGDFITQVDGKTMTPDNYSTALTNETLSLTLGEMVNSEVVSTSKTVKVTKAEVQTDPIHYSTVLEYGNKKIGYLVYLQFLTSFDDAMRKVFADFKAKGVNELVLDLRYNGGGYISSSEILSSLIVKNLKPNTLMSRQEWNAALTTAFKNQYGANVFDANWLNEANNLGTLNRVYILTSQGTASASELVINNLKPFMDVILIGDHTYGKNVGSITLSDDKKRWKYGMQPIVLRTVNAIGKSDYGTKEGFIPDFKVEDKTMPFKSFGDPTETLLKVAIENITGQPVTLGTSKARVAATKDFNVLDKSPRLDTRKYELKDMFVDRFPGQK